MRKSGHQEKLGFVRLDTMLQVKTRSNQSAVVNFTEKDWDPLTTTDMSKEFARMVASYALDTRLGICCIICGNSETSLKLSWKRLQASILAVAPPKLAGKFKAVQKALKTARRLNDSNDTCPLLPEDIQNILTCLDLTKTSRDFSIEAFSASGTLGPCYPAAPETIASALQAIEKLRSWSSMFDDVNNSPDGNFWPPWGRPLARDHVWAERQLPKLLKRLLGVEYDKETMRHVGLRFTPTYQAMRRALDIQEDTIVCEHRLEALEFLVGGTIVPRPPLQS